VCALSKVERRKPLIRTLQLTAQTATYPGSRPIGMLPAIRILFLRWQALGEVSRAQIPALAGQPHRLHLEEACNAAVAHLISRLAALVDPPSSCPASRLMQWR
jgi:hypothetical protein